jgi:hypothetical protein
MKPAIVPSKRGISKAALDDAAQYGAMGKYRQQVDRAQTVALDYVQHGLPAEFEPLDVIRGGLPKTRGTDFWIYVEASHGMYLGFAESARGEWLRLVAFRPVDLISLDDMIDLTRKAT